jgi:hypothetical protein
MALPLYLLRKSPRHPVDRRLGGPHNQFVHCAEEKNLSMLGIEPGPTSPSICRKRYNVRIYCYIVLSLYARHVKAYNIYYAI